MTKKRGTLLVMTPRRVVKKNLRRKSITRIIKLINFNRKTLKNINLLKQKHK